MGSVINMRLLRAYQIASKLPIKWMGSGVANVASQSRPGTFHITEVAVDGTVPCSCEDWAKRKLSRCKHGEALLLSLSRYTEQERAAWPKGYIVPPVPFPAHLSQEESEIVALYDGARRRPPVRIEYPKGELQESTRRNQAYRDMRKHVPEMLRDLCRLNAEGRPLHKGMQELLVHDRAFSVVYRTFANRCLDDVVHELQGLAVHKFIEWAPCKNSLCSYLHDDKLTPVLEELLKRTAEPVRLIERAAIVDSTGIATIMSANYLDTDRGKKVVRKQNDWLKLHAVCGASTGIIAGIIATHHLRTGKDDDPKNQVADVAQFPALMDMATAIWDLRWALADKAYLSDENLLKCEDLGIRAVIPVKRKWNPLTKKAAYAIELDNWYREETASFEEIYRYRSLIEGVFSAIKRCTSPWMRTRGPKLPANPSDEQLWHVGIARYNEMLAKCIVHNLRRLVMLEKLHGHEVNFTLKRAFTPLPQEWIKGDRFDFDDEFVADVEHRTQHTSGDQSLDEAV